MPDAAVKPAGGLAIRFTGIATVLLSLVVLRMARDVAVPIVGGALLAALAWPVLRRAERILPRPLALLATVLLVVAIVTGLFGAIGWSAARMGERILERRDRLEALHEQAGGAVRRVGLELPPLPGSRDSGGDTGSDSGGDTAQRVGRTLFSLFGAMALTIGFMALALAEVRSTRERIRTRFGPERAGRILGISGEVAGTMRRYIVVKSITSGIAGVSTLLLTLAFGLDFAIVWGMLAFLLEYVPTVGSLLAVVPPALYALIQFDGLGRALALTGALTLMQLFLGNYVDPKIEGRLLFLSPFVVLASIVLWAWVWGAPGALLGVPLTVALTTIARHFESSRWIWAVLTQPNGDGRSAADGQ